MFELDDQDFNSMSMCCSCGGGSTGTGELRDYTLQPISPCIDAGTADYDGDGINDISDYVGLAPDMGKSEFLFVLAPGQLGDVSLDNEVNISDIIIIVGFIMGDQQPTLEEFWLSDYNSDAIINVNDIIGIIYFILELTPDNNQTVDTFVSPDNNLINLKGLYPLQIPIRRPISLD